MSPPAAPKRDPRIDVLRGMALLMIFIDHVPNNLLASLTLRNFGFSDAAELFVLLAGFSSVMAYGRVFERDGFAPGLRRVVGRCVQLYSFQVGLLLATLGIFKLWTTFLHGLQPLYVGPLLKGGVKAIVSRGFTLEFLPTYLDILPLYIVLLGIFPLIYGLLRVSVGLTLAASLALWAGANLLGWNLPNGATGYGWFFNPFAWQLLFVIGAVGAHAARRHPERTLPRTPLLLAGGWVYLVSALVIAAPWRSWGLPDVRFVPFDMVLPMSAKSNLSPWRLANILALAYVALTSERFRTAAGGRWWAPVRWAGQHSLAIFSLGTVLALVGRLVFRTYGTDWPEQLGVNGIGLTGMLVLAWRLEESARRRKAAEASGGGGDGTGRPPGDPAATTREQPLVAAPPREKPAPAGRAG